MSPPYSFLHCTLRARAEGRESLNLVHVKYG
jgi:hypothetical protein